jgi:cell division protease FtsH
LVAMLLPGADPVHKVTIIPRGMALGITQQLPLDDRYTYTREYLMTRLAMMFGGRTAEDLVFGHMTTGAGDDIEKATELARKMVCEFGMSTELGPMTFGRKDEQVFLGKDFHHQRDYSEHTAIEIDRAVRGMIQEAYDTAHSLLSENMAALHAIAEKLLEKEVLDGAEVEALVKAYRTDGGISQEAPAEAVAIVAEAKPVEVPREKPEKASEENRGGVPGLPPKPVLA